MPLSLSQRIICWLGYGVVYLLHRSYRYQRLNEDVRIKARQKSPQGQVAYACWHQNTLTTVMAHFYERVMVLVSRSFDGEIIASIIKRFGVGSARGSSSRGGREALRELIEGANTGYDIGVTVDGPRGPRHKVKMGVITLAARSGIPILPTLVRGKRVWTFHKSWDQFRLAKPFTDIYVVYGEPIWVQAELSDAAMNSLADEIRDRLFDLEQELEKRMSLAHATQSKSRT